MCLNGGNGADVQTCPGRSRALSAQAAASQQSLHGVDCVSSAARETRTAAYHVIEELLPLDLSSPSAF